MADLRSRLLLSRLLPRLALPRLVLPRLVLPRLALPRLALPRLVRGAALLLLLALPACESAEERLAAHMARGEALVAAGEDQKARLEFANALRLAPDHLAAHLALARLYERAGDPEGMIRHLQKAVEIAPGEVWAQVRLAGLALGAGEYDRARTHVGAALAAAPDHAEARATAAALAYTLGDTATAVAEAERAVAIEPFQPLAGAVLIRETARRGEGPRAREMALAWLAARPEDEGLHRLRLELLAAAGDETGIGAELAALAALRPAETAYLSALVDWHLGRNDAAGALDRLAARAAMPGVRAAELGDLARALALRLAASGDPGAARAALASLALRAADRTGFAMILAEFDFVSGRGAAAKAALEALAAGPGTAEEKNAARVLLARLHMVDSGPGDPEAAQALLDAVLAADAKNVAALAVRAELALARGDAEAALADLGLALGEAPRQADLLLLAAETQRRLGNAILAGEHLARAVQAAGFAPAETLAYAGFLEGQARAPEAEAVLAEAARRRPGDAAILARLAEIRLGLGDWPGAETVATELRRIEAAGLADRISAAALAGRGEHEAGIVLLERLAADPGARERAMAALVEAYLAAGTPERAKAFLDGLLEGEPGHPQALLLRAGLAERAGDAAAAEADLRALVAARPDLARAHLGLAEFLLRRGGEGAEEAAGAALHDGLAAVPEDPALRFRLATLAERRGETRAAIAGYEALLAGRPGSLLLVNNVVSLIADHHADDPELLARARAIAAPLRAATAPELQDTYGWLLHLSGDDAGALRSLQPAAEALPGNPWVRYHLGMTLAALGQKDGARDHLGAALAQGGADFPPAAAIRAALAGLGP